MAVDYNALLNKAGEAAAAHGMDFRGKKYSLVSTRVELFRRAYGDTAGISTEILHLGLVQGEPIVIRASISFDGRVIATGTAWEVIGKGNVNQSSALENAETSAVGRALAVLGLHGGEMASANEMERIPDKPANPSPDGLEAAWQDHVLEAAGLDHDSDPAEVAKAFADAMCEKIASYKELRYLEQFGNGKRKTKDFIAQNNADEFDRVKAAYTEQYALLRGGKRAA